MKRVAFFSVVCAAFLILGCEDINTLKNLSDNTPESISIKTDAHFEVPLGGKDFTLLDNFNIEKIQTIINDNLPSSGEDEENLTPTVYDYNLEKDDSGVITYIVDYPVLKYNLSLTDDSGKDIDLNVNQVPIGPQPIDAPDFNELIKEKLSIPSETLTIPELGSEVYIDEISKTYSGFNPSISITITAPKFETMSFYTGNLDITITPQNAGSISDDFILSPKITLYSDDVEISKSSEDEVVEIKKEQKTITLKLDDKKIKKDLKIVVSGKILGGASPEPNPENPSDIQYKTNEYTFSVSTSNIELKEVTGLEMTNEELGDKGKIKFDQSFSLSALNKHLQSAEVKEGTLQIYSELPTGWHGIKIDSENSNFVVSGGLNLENSDFTDGEEIGTKYILNKTANLIDCTIEPGTEVKTNGSYISVSLKDATIMFEKGESAELFINGICTIKELGDVIISIGDLQTIKDTKDTGLNFSTLLSDALDGEKSDLLKNIEFSGIQAYFFVTQPTSNECLKSLAITGTVKAKYTDKDKEPEEEYLVNIPSGSDNPIRIKPTTITLASLANENFVISEDTVFQDKGADSLYSFKLEDNSITKVLNDLPDKLVFDYDLAIKTNSTDGTATLTQADIDLVSSKAQISISLAIVIPLKLILNDVSDGDNDGWITIDDMMALVDKETDEKTDILNRDKPDEYADKTKYTDIIKALSLSYTINNTTPFNLEITVNDEATEIIKELKTETGTASLDFESDEITKIMNNFFNPKFKVCVEATGEELELKRNAAFGFKGVFSVTTDGTVKVWGKNGEDEDKDE
ncbi:MAG: hypothetical protein IJ158_11785 [Treponema sp.]|nr:hypothetical protein [Treponema sp.]